MAVSQALTLHERDGKGPMFEPDLAARPVPQPDCTSVKQGVAARPSATEKPQGACAHEAPVPSPGGTPDSR